MLGEPYGTGFDIKLGSSEALKDFIDALEKHNLLIELVDMYKTCCNMADEDTETTAEINSSVHDRPDTHTVKRLDGDTFEITRPGPWHGTQKFLIDLTGTVQGDELGDMRFSPFEGIAVEFPKVLKETAAKHTDSVFSGKLFASDFDHYDADILFSFENGALKIKYKMIDSWLLPKKSLIEKCISECPAAQSVDFSLPLSDEAKFCIAEFLKPYYLLISESERYPDEIMASYTPECIEIKI